MNGPNLTSNLALSIALRLTDDNMDQKSHLSVRQFDLIATCLNTLDLEELTKVERSFKLWHGGMLISHVA